MSSTKARATAGGRSSGLRITIQRSVVILKDVLDELLKDIAELLDLTVDAVKAHLARGRARLREINARAATLAEAKPASEAVARYVTLFNARNSGDFLLIVVVDSGAL
jgi:Sigma-70, region 4